MTMVQGTNETKVCAGVYFSSNIDACEEREGRERRTFCQTSFCVSFASVSLLNGPAKGWRCVRFEFPEKKGWRARIRSMFDSSRGKRSRERGVWDQIRVRVYETGKRSQSHSQFLQFTLCYSSGKRWKYGIDVSV